MKMIVEEVRDKRKIEDMKDSSMDEFQQSDAQIDRKKD